jgi:hypothetical protein
LGLQIDQPGRQFRQSSRPRPLRRSPRSRPSQDAPDHQRPHRYRDEAARQEPSATTSGQAGRIAGAKQVFGIRIAMRCLGQALSVGDGNPVRSPVKRFEVACRTSCSEVGGETLSLVKRPQLTFSEIALKAGQCQNRNRAPKIFIGIGGGARQRGAIDTSPIQPHSGRQLQVTLCCRPHLQTKSVQTTKTGGMSLLFIEHERRSERLALTVRALGC